MSAVCHRVCCLTSSVPPGKQDQDQPTFLVRVKAARLSWPQYMVPPGLREWILQFQYFLMVIQTPENSWVHCHKSDFDCQQHGDKGDSEKETGAKAWQVHKGLRQCKGKVSRLTEVTVFVAWCNSEFRNRDEASLKFVPLRLQLKI